MIFNSYGFLYVFLPISILGFAVISRVGRGTLALYWLIFLSILFYGYWSFSNLVLLFLLIVLNYLIGKAITSYGGKKSTVFVIFGVAFNLGILAYFKYTNFLIDIINILSLNISHVSDLVLPLGISFYTFEQISYLINLSLCKTKRYLFSHYLLFVLFFPHLVAGPILHPNELFPQFSKLKFGLTNKSFAIGITVFSLGLFKKVVIADHIASYVSPVFDNADSGMAISFLPAWQAAIAYTLQLYFDFSGYSDMAVGLGRIFNIKLPINFFSPYKSISIIDFWRRWHITLSRFLRDYLYIPLGGNRKGVCRQYFNLMVTMLIGGLWHGASWTFIVWGGLHGAFLCINHAWDKLQERYPWKVSQYFLSSVLARSLTFFLIVMSWVIFRATNLSGACQIFKGMFGFNGLITPSNLNLYDTTAWMSLLPLLVVVWFLPNLYEYMGRKDVALDIYRHLDGVLPLRYGWRPNIVHAIVTGLSLVASSMMLERQSQFLYFQF